MSDYVHSGPKFGMFCGIFTAAYPSSYGWSSSTQNPLPGRGFLKYDYCNKPAGPRASAVYGWDGAGLRRDILSACSWGADETRWINPPARICGARPATSPTGNRLRT
ncbi:MAG: hypothetical protein ACLUFV_01185 [Acutalibacteraceae bacterium]